jgi:hypothetical protein
MDIAILKQYLTLSNIQTVLAIVGSIVTVASTICAGTPTPDPNTKLGKFYRIIEFLAINIGKAKDTGMPIATDSVATTNGVNTVVTFPDQSTATSPAQITTHE